MTEKPVAIADVTTKEQCAFEGEWFHQIAQCMFESECPGCKKVISDQVDCLFMRNDGTCENCYLNRK